MSLLTRSLIISCSFFSFCFAQNINVKKYNYREIQFTKDACYSRSFIVKNDTIYAACSNGALYVYDVKNDSSLNLMHKKKFEEMRDLELIDNKLLGMQSGSFGVLALTDKHKFNQYVFPKDNIWYKTFLDAMDFHQNVGFILGDPVNQKFNLSFSIDKGKTWEKCQGEIEAFEKEFAFAASGTTVQVLNSNTFVFVSGGKKSRFFKSIDQGKTWSSTSLPFLTNETSGAFSIHMKDELNGVIVGGDYASPDLNSNVAFYTEDGGKFWLNAEKQPGGYRSCVIHSGTFYFSCGTNGIDYSDDEGITWKKLVDGEYFSMCFDNNKLYASVRNGKIAVFDFK